MKLDLETLLKLHLSCESDPATGSGLSTIEQGLKALKAILKCEGFLGGGAVGR